VSRLPFALSLQVHTAVLRQAWVKQHELGDGPAACGKLRGHFKRDQGAHAKGDDQDRPPRIALDELRDIDRGNVLEPVIALSATNAWELEQVELLALSEHLAELGLGQSESNAAVNQKDWRAPSCSHRRLG